MLTKRYRYNNIEIVIQFNNHVDKMASYVARNGRSFEDVVRSKGENRKIEAI
jgi:hypothetical protein